MEMIKKHLARFILIAVAPLGLIAQQNYNIVIEGYDWGPAVNKVILPMEETVKEVKGTDYRVEVERSAEGVEMSAEESKGERNVVYAYVSDSSGGRVEEGKYITLVLYVAPNDVLGSPIKYIRANNRGSNQWIEYQIKVTNKPSGKIWNTEGKRYVDLVDEFDLKGSYTHKDKTTLTFASFVPKTNKENVPLIIWLHGGGEGGTDPSIPLIANRATNYASDEIQAIMGGAYVLVPQTPTFWMQSASGNYTRGQTNDIYNEALMGLIKTYVKHHPGVDKNRIYLGGCSNGGYMSLKLMLLHPDYFAAGYISALAYHNEYITEEQIAALKDQAIWFIHAKDDPVTLPDKTVVPLYDRLVDAGAKNVHFSYFDHVTDITGFYGGDDYRYNGHWSWIYSHANKAMTDYKGEAVMLNGRPVSIMEWMAQQHK